MINTELSLDQLQAIAGILSQDDRMVSTEDEASVTSIECKVPAGYEALKDSLIVIVTLLLDGLIRSQILVLQLFEFLFVSNGGIFVVCVHILARSMMLIKPGSNALCAWVLVASSKE